MGCRCLERLGYTVEGNTDPMAALKRFKDRPELFDLVITDLSMPQKNGDRLCRELRRIRQDIPVIRCTGYSHVPAAQCTPAAFLQKPYVIRSLAEAVRDAMAKKRPGQCRPAAGGPGGVR